ncbi:MAG: hypothetical protein HZC03_02270 [Candidatus Lloydbacteria bacterium]|nr:hypothetical protein [Candidatus Lloydbacteria bacterium]
MNLSQEQLKEKYNRLPQDVKDAIFSAGVEKALTEIGEKYGLHIDKIGELMEVVDLVMLGITEPKDFIRNLYDRLGIEDKEQVRRVAHEVNERVFQKIRESLKTVHSIPSETSESVPKERAVPIEKILETKNDMLGKIEHPEKDEKDIIKEKLQKMNSMPKEESKYEIKTDSRDKTKVYADPYREPIS